MSSAKNFGINDLTKQKIINLINALIPEVKIYLFGSRAKGTYHERSDIDIALDAGKPLNVSQLGELKDVLNATNISYKIDVVDINSLPEDMYFNIKKELILWKE